MSQPPSPSEITNLAKRVGLALTASHNAYAALYRDAYHSASGMDSVFNAVTHEKKDSQRQILSAYANTLEHTARALEGHMKAMGTTWQEAEAKRLCNHCDERVALPHSKYCGFCFTWAKQHMGNLPSDAVLDSISRNNAGRPKKKK